jgi:hypothetical protein
LILKTFALDDCDDLLLLRNRVGGHSGEWIELEWCTVTSILVFCPVKLS